MPLRYFSKIVLCIVVGGVVLGMRTSVSAVPMQTTYSYVGVDYTYQPGSPFTYKGDPYPQPGTDYAAAMGVHLTASVTLDGDTSTFTGSYTTGYLGNPVGYRGVLSFLFISGPIAGVGIPGLLMAIAGFIGWLRKRSAVA